VITPTAWMSACGPDRSAKTYPKDHSRPAWGHAGGCRPVFGKRCQLGWASFKASISGVSALGPKYGAVCIWGFDLAVGTMDCR